LKSPNAITLSALSPNEPASTSEFPENLFGGNGHIAEQGSMIDSNDRDKADLHRFRCIVLWSGGRKRQGV
jgi:hypothetical protein